jgi:tetraacyldisaccharide 4'-kinase
MRARLHKIIEKCWYGGSGAAVLLLPFAWLFASLAWTRKTLYLSGILARPELPVPVIVVGNLSVGGTGKTPLVHWLCKQLQQAGFRPGIVSRGYGGTHSGGPLLVTAHSDPAVVGDEPLLLTQLTGCPVCISADRVAAVGALAEQGVDVVISDDGLQHYRMQRDVELVVVDGERGFGNGLLLPAGPLRESLNRLDQVDAVLINGGSADIAGTSFKLDIQAVTALDGPGEKSLNSFAAGPVWALAGIGNPGRFYAELERAGIDYAPVSVPDHGRCDLQALRAKQQQPILMTQKDAVKYMGSAPDDSWYVPVEVSIEADEAAKLIELIKHRIISH